MKDGKIACCVNEELSCFLYKTGIKIRLQTSAIYLVLLQCSTFATYKEKIALFFGESSEADSIFFLSLCLPEIWPRNTRSLFQKSSQKEG